MWSIKAKKNVMVKQRPKTLDLKTSKQLCREKKKKGKHQKPAKKQILVAKIIKDRGG